MTTLPHRAVGTEHTRMFPGYMDISDFPWFQSIFNSATFQLFYDRVLLCKSVLIGCSAFMFVRLDVQGWQEVGILRQFGTFPALTGYLKKYYNGFNEVQAS